MPENNKPTYNFARNAINALPEISVGLNDENIVEMMSNPTPETTAKLKSMWKAATDMGHVDFDFNTFMAKMNYNPNAKKPQPVVQKPAPQKPVVIPTNTNVDIYSMANTEFLNHRKGAELVNPDAGKANAAALQLQAQLQEMDKFWQDPMKANNPILVQQHNAEVARLSQQLQAEKNKAVSLALKPSTTAGPVVVNKDPKGVYYNTQKQISEQVRLFELGKRNNNMQGMQAALSNLAALYQQQSNFAWNYSLPENASDDDRDTQFYLKQEIQKNQMYAGQNFRPLFKSPEKLKSLMAEYKYNSKGEIIPDNVAMKQMMKAKYNVDFNYDENNNVIQDDVYKNAINAAYEKSMKEIKSSDPWKFTAYSRMPHKEAMKRYLYEQLIPKLRTYEKTGSSDSQEYKNLMQDAINLYAYTTYNIEAKDVPSATYSRGLKGNAERLMDDIESGKSEQKYLGTIGDVVGAGLSYGGGLITEASLSIAKDFDDASKKVEDKLRDYSITVGASNVKTGGNTLKDSRLTPFDEEFIGKAESAKRGAINTSSDEKLTEYYSRILSATGQEPTAALPPKKMQAYVSEKAYDAGVNLIAFIGEAYTGNVVFTEAMGIVKAGAMATSVGSKAVAGYYATMANLASKAAPGFFNTLKTGQMLESGYVIGAKSLLKAHEWARLGSVYRTTGAIFNKSPEEMGYTTALYGIAGSSAVKQLFKLSGATGKFMRGLWNNSQNTTMPAEMKGRMGEMINEFYGFAVNKVGAGLGESVEETMEEISTLQQNKKVDFLTAAEAFKKEMLKNPEDAALFYGATMGMGLVAGAAGADINFYGKQAQAWAMQGMQALINSNPQAAQQLTTTFQQSSGIATANGLASNLANASGVIQRDADLEQAFENSTAKAKAHAYATQVLGIKEGTTKYNAVIDVAKKSFMDIHGYTGYNQDKDTPDIVSLGDMLTAANNADDSVDVTPKTGAAAMIEQVFDNFAERDADGKVKVVANSANAVKAINSIQEEMDADLSQMQHMEQQGLQGTQAYIDLKNQYDENLNNFMELKSVVEQSNKHATKEYQVRSVVAQAYDAARREGGNALDHLNVFTESLPKSIVGEESIHNKENLSESDKQTVRGLFELSERGGASNELLKTAEDGNPSKFVDASLAAIGTYKNGQIKASNIEKFINGLGISGNAKVDALMSKIDLMNSTKDKSEKSRLKSEIQKDIIPVLEEINNIAVKGGIDADNLPIKFVPHIGVNTMGGVNQGSNMLHKAALDAKNSKAATEAKKSIEAQAKETSGETNKGVFGRIRDIFRMKMDKGYVQAREMRVLVKALALSDLSLEDFYNVLVANGYQFNTSDNWWVNYTTKKGYSSQIETVKAELSVMIDDLAKDLYGEKPTRKQKAEAERMINEYLLAKSSLEKSANLHQQFAEEAALIEINRIEEKFNRNVGIENLKEEDARTLVNNIMADWIDGIKQKNVKKISEARKQLKDIAEQASKSKKYYLANSSSGITGTINKAIEKLDDISMDTRVSGLSNREANEVLNRIAEDINKIRGVNTSTPSSKESKQSTDSYSIYTKDGIDDLISQIYENTKKLELAGVYTAEQAEEQIKKEVKQLMDDVEFWNSPSSSNIGDNDVTNVVDNEAINIVDKAAKRYSEIVSDRRIDELLLGGIIDSKQADALKSRNQYYVPFKVYKELEDALDPENKEFVGADITKTLARVKGRKVDPDNDENMLNEFASPMELGVTALSRSMGQAQANNVINSFKNFIESVPEISKGDDFVVKVVEVDNFGNVKDEDFEVPFYDNGKKRALRFSTKEMKNVFSNMSTKKADALSKIVPAANYFRKIKTVWSPVWAVRNSPKDIQTAHKQLAFFGVKNIHFPELIKEVAKANVYLFGMNKNSEYAELEQEAIKAGALFGHAELARTAAEYRKNQERYMGDKGDSILADVVGPDRKNLRKAFDLASNFAANLENATRLAAYKLARKNGKTIKEAAHIARESTTNFDRGGNIFKQNPWLNSVLMFTKIGIQGNYRSYRNTVRLDINGRQQLERLIWKAATYTIRALLGYGVYTMVTDDDDEESLEKYLSNFVGNLKKQYSSSLISFPMLGDSEYSDDDRVLSISAAQGDNFSNTLMDNMMIAGLDAVLKGMNPNHEVMSTKEHLLRLLNAELRDNNAVVDMQFEQGNILPNYQAGYNLGFMQPIIDLWNNKDSFGREKSNVEEYERAGSSVKGKYNMPKDKTSKTAIAASKFMFEASGSAIDIFPETLEGMANSYLPMVKEVGIGYNLVKGDIDAAKDAALLSKVKTEKSYYMGRLESFAKDTDLSKDEFFDAMDIIQEGSFRVYASTIYMKNLEKEKALEEIEKMKANGEKEEVIAKAEADVEANLDKAFKNLTQQYNEYYEEQENLFKTIKEKGNQAWFYEYSRNRK